MFLACWNQILCWFGICPVWLICQLCCLVTLSDHVHDACGNKPCTRSTSFCIDLKGDVPLLCAAAAARPRHQEPGHLAGALQGLRRCEAQRGAGAEARALRLSVQPGASAIHTLQAVCPALSLNRNVYAAVGWCSLRRCSPRCMYVLALQHRDCGPYLYLNFSLTREQELVRRLWGKVSQQCVTQLCCVADLGHGRREQGGRGHDQGCAPVQPDLWQQAAGRGVVHGHDPECLQGDLSPMCSAAMLQLLGKTRNGWDVHIWHVS